MLMHSSSNGGTIRPCPRCKFIYLIREIEI
jgi:hypothetical protein